MYMYRDSTHKLYIQPIPLGVTFSKAQSSKLERLFCHISLKRHVQALSFELWNSIRKCHPKWDRLYICFCIRWYVCKKPHSSFYTCICTHYYTCRTLHFSTKRECSVQMKKRSPKKNVRIQSINGKRDCTKK